MNVTRLIRDWTIWAPLLKTNFPHGRFPDGPPTGAKFAALTADLASAHDLTLAEVHEVIEDLSFNAVLEKPASKAA